MPVEPSAGHFSHDGTILFCQKMIFPNSSAHAIHAGLTAANFAGLGARTFFFPGFAWGKGECLDDFFRQIGCWPTPEKLIMKGVPFRHKGLYGLLFRASLWRAMSDGPRVLCFASSVKEAVAALSLRALSPNRENIRVVFEMHHLISRLKTGAQAKALYALEKKAVSGADLVVFNCLALREQAKGYLPECRNWIVSPLGYNERTIRPAGRAGVERRDAEIGLVYVGSLQPGKGVEKLLRALCRLPEKYRLTIIGGRPEQAFQALRELAASLGLEERVAFTGQLEQTELAAKLDGKDIFVIPLETPDDFLAPLKMFEALGFAMPIAASPMPSLRETLLEDENAVFAEDASPQGIAAAIIRLGEDQALREKMRRANLERAASLTGKARAKTLLDEFSRLF